MPFVKGGAGRPKGTINKNKCVVREIVEAALGKTLPQALIDLAGEMTNKSDKARILEGLLPYAYPKLASVEVSAEVFADLSIESEVERYAKWLAETKEMK